MADFYSDRDINDAINRVRQMQQKADSYLPHPKHEQERPIHQAKPTPPQPQHNNIERSSQTHIMKNIASKSSSNPISSLISSIFSGDKDKLLIMGLILILSKEQGDQMLIMALLYILL